jgi:hypothetical protein
MSFSESERAILASYHDKTRLAGGANAGYLLRVGALATLLGGTAHVESGLAQLADKGLVQPTEAGDRYYLTEAGAELVSQGPASW